MRKCLIFCFIFSICILSSSALAATFNVSTTPELREALLEAAQNGQEDTIVIADGNYQTTDDGEGTFIFISNEDYDLTLKGSSAENVILSGSNLHQVLNFEIPSFDRTVTLENLSIINGFSNYGGGIMSREALVINNCKIDNNSATVSGGGFWAEVYATVIDSIISNNISEGAGGFVINTPGGLGLGPTPPGLLTISNSIIANNFSYSTGGGFVSGVTTNITDSNISNNSANNCGGGFQVGPQPFISPYSVPVTITNSSLNGNTAVNCGGGFSASGGSFITINKSVFSGNISLSGGGFWTDYRGTVNIIQDIFYDNIGTESGGGFWTSRPITVVNSLFINNGLNDGIFLHLFTSTTTITSQIVNSIFLNNGAYEITGEEGVLLSLKTIFWMNQKLI